MVAAKKYLETFLGQLPLNALFLMNTLSGQLKSNYILYMILSQLPICTCRAGAELLEEHPVKDATFDKSKGLWTVNIESGKSFTVSSR